MDSGLHRQGHSVLRVVRAHLRSAQLRIPLQYRVAAPGKHWKALIRNIQAGALARRPPGATTGALLTEFIARAVEATLKPRKLLNKK